MSFVCFFCSSIQRHPRSTLFPYTTLFRSIQSGNVLFSAIGSNAKLTKQIETALSKTFNYQSRVVVRSLKQMKDIVTNAPKGRSEEHTSELQSQSNLVCRLLLEKKKKKQ